MGFGTKPMICYEAISYLYKYRPRALLEEPAGMAFVRGGQSEEGKKRSKGKKGW
jgi:hypothetical protein